MSLIPFQKMAKPDSFGSAWGRVHKVVPDLTETIAIHHGNRKNKRAKSQLRYIGRELFICNFVVVLDLSAFTKSSYEDEAERRAEGESRKGEARVRSARHR